MRSIPKPKWSHSGQWAAGDCAAIVERRSAAGSVLYDVYFNGSRIGEIEKVRYTPHKVVGRIRHDFRSRWGWQRVAGCFDYSRPLRCDTAGEAIINLLDHRVRADAEADPNGCANPRGDTHP